MEDKNVKVGCGCGCLVLIVIILLIIGTIGACVDQSKLEQIKGSEKVIVAADSCSFGPFAKKFYKMSLEEEIIVFETSLEDNEFKWCGTLLDIKQKDDKYYFFVSAYKRHFTGEAWNVFKVRHTNRLPYVVRVESDLKEIVDLSKAKNFTRGDYISFEGELEQRGVNEKGNKRYWEMVNGNDFKLKKHAKKKRKTTYKKDLIKSEKEEKKLFEKLREERRKEEEKARKTIQEDNDEIYEVDDEPEETEPAVKRNFRSCSELEDVYPNGVSKGHAAYNPNLDGDKDGHACGE